MQFVHLLAALSLCALAVFAAPSGWPRQNMMRYNPEDSMMVSINSRAYLPPRYKNLFGTGSSKVQAGFIPKTMSEFTGKVGALRRQTFSWRPEFNPLQDV